MIHINTNAKNTQLIHIAMHQKAHANCVKLNKQQQQQQQEQQTNNNQFDTKRIPYDAMLTRQPTHPAYLLPQPQRMHEYLLLRGPQTKFCNSNYEQCMYIVLYIYICIRCF